MRWDSVRERFKQGAKAGANHVERHPEQLKDALLRCRVVDAQAATTQLIAVANDVVRVRSHVVRTLFNERHVFYEWAGERVMRVSEVTLVVLVEQIGRVDPEKLPLFLTNQLSTPRHLLPDQPHDGLGFAPPVGRDQHQVVGTGAGEALDGRDLFLREEFVQWPARKPCQPLPASASGDRHQLVELAPGHFFSVGHGQSANNPFGRKYLAEDLGFRLRKCVAQVADFQLVTQIWFVRPVAQK